MSKLSNEKEKSILNHSVLKRLIKCLPMLYQNVNEGISEQGDEKNTPCN